MDRRVARPPHWLQCSCAQLNRNCPINVTAENEHALWEVQEAKGPQQVTRRDVTTPYQVGDQVRVSVAKAPFAKGYLPNWSEQIYTVVRRLETLPLQYKLQDYNNEEIKGSFYSAELQAIVPPERYVLKKLFEHGRWMAGRSTL